MTSISIFRAALLAGLIGAGGAGAAAAQGWGGPHHHRGGDGFAMLHALSLTDAQKTQVHAAMKAGFDAAKPYRQQLHAIDDQIKSKLAASGSVTMADIAPLLQQKEQVQAELDQNRYATILQVRSLLTPDQIAKAATMEAQLASLHHQEHDVLKGQ